MRAIDWFYKGCRFGEDRRFFVAPDGRSYSYGELRQVADLAGAAIAHGSPRQPHVAILSPNDPRAFGCMLAAWAAGGVWVPLSAKNPPAALIAFLKSTDVDWLFYHSSLRDTAQQIRQALGISNLVCLDAGGEDCSLEDLMARGRSLPAPRLLENPDRPVAIFPTGGTTGASKAALISELCWETMFATAQLIMPTATPPVHLLAAPMTHAAGGFAAVLMAQGAENIVLDRVDPQLILQTIASRSVTHLFLPPTALYALLAQPNVRAFDVSSLRYLMVGAAPISPAKLAEAVEVFGPVLCQQWGQAEAPFFLTWITPQEIADAVRVPERRARLASCGRETPLTRVCVLDDEGRPAAVGEAGELAVQGNLRMLGYYGDPEATAELRDAAGWQRTGDIGRMDADGFCYIVDRKRDMIISGGFNVFSVEVEACLNAHPAVEVSAVFGTPDDRWGEMVTAAVQLKPGALATADDLTLWTRAELGPVKAPKRILMMEELPRSPVGKVLKRELRDTFWGARERRVN